MAAAVAACSIAGLKQSRTKAQTKATLCACFALALVVGAFCVVVIVCSQSWAALSFACLAAVAPLAAYCAAMVAWGSVAPFAQPDAREASRRPMSERSELEARPVAAASAPAKRAIPAPPLPVDTALDACPERPAVFTPVKYKADHDANAEAISTAAEAPAPASLIERSDSDIRKRESVLSAEPNLQPKPAPAPVAAPAPTPVAAPAPASVPVPMHISAPASLLVPAPAPAPLPAPAETSAAACRRAPGCEPESAPASSAASEPLQAPRAFDASRYFERAEALREKGRYIVAARLYAQCAHLVDEQAIRRKALVEEVACYVRADRLDDAKQRAETLLAQTDDLAPIEKLKLEAVVKAAG